MEGGPPASVSVVQMPGGVPVATMSLGKAGAKNAGVFAAQIVATLRETSVLFGAAIAVIWLKEPLRPVRIGAALLIVCGLVLIRLQ